MNANEEDLQKKIEAGIHPSGDELDVRAYHEVFARLKKTPESFLSSDFADKVIVRVQEKQKRSASRDFFWFTLGAFLLVVTLVVATVLTGFKPTLGFLNGMSGYAGLFAFGLAVILVLNHLDKKLLPKSRR